MTIAPSLRQRLSALMMSGDYDGHPLPRTRRDLLKLGLLSLGASAVPGWWPRNASGADEPTGAPDVPFLTFDLVGGAALPGNFLVGKQGGSLDLCSSYHRLGWNPRESDSLDVSFGIPMSKQRSQILAGLRSQLPPEMYDAQGRCAVQMAGLLHFALNDQPDNILAATSLVSAAGLIGTTSRSALGTAGSLSGGYSRAFLEQPALKPKAIRSINDLVNILSLSKTFDGMSESRRVAILRELQARGLAQAQELGIDNVGVRSALESLENLGSANREGDPRSNPTIAAIYGLNSPQAAVDRNGSNVAVEAAIVLSTLLRKTGPGVIAIGGCDYHVANAAVSEAKDLQIGVSLGRALRAAFELKTPLFFHIITDGGIYTQPSESYTRIWAGDEVQHSMSVIGFYHPTRRVELIKSQVGAYTNAGLVDQTTTIGGSAQVAALTAFANYLAVTNNLGVFEAVSGRRFSNIGGDSSLVFA